MADVLRVLSTLALKGAVERLAGRYQATTGVRLDADFAPTVGLMKRLREGETADLLILTREGLDELVASGPRCRPAPRPLHKGCGSIQARLLGGWGAQAEHDPSELCGSGGSLLYDMHFKCFPLRVEAR